MTDRSVAGVGGLVVRQLIRDTTRALAVCAVHAHLDRVPWGSPPAIVAVIAVIAP